MGLCVQMVLTVLTLSVGFKGGEVVPSFYIGATFGCVVGPLLGLPAGFSAAVGLVCVFCGRPIRWWLPLYWRLSCSAGPGLS